ncbi:hypothetical protein D3C83_44570 [compost metagenome]
MGGKPWKQREQQRAGSEQTEQQQRTQRRQAGNMHLRVRKFEHAGRMRDAAGDLRAGIDPDFVAARVTDVTQNAGRAQNLDLLTGKFDRPVDFTQDHDIFAIGFEPAVEPSGDRDIATGK